MLVTLCDVSESAWQRTVLQQRGYSGVIDTVLCVWQWWQQTVLQQQWGYSDVSDTVLCADSGDSRQCRSSSERPQAVVHSLRSCHAWVCLGQILWHKLYQLTTQHSTTQQPPYTNTSNLRCSPLPSSTAAISVTVSVLAMCCITWRHCGKKDIIFLKIIICNFHPLLLRAFGDLFSWPR